MSKRKSQAEFIQWMPYILMALREHRGSATPREVYETVAKLAHVPDEKRFAKLGTGNLRYPNQVAWARQYLLWEGLLSSPKRGLWMLTPAAQVKQTLSIEESGEIFKKWAAIHAARRATGKQSESPAIQADEIPSSDVAPENYKEEILARLQQIHPDEFERFCADLLRHLGMERVEVTGGRGDKGIDGEGYLQVGPLVTTKIAFQCKRYTGAVGAKDVREFQGAIGSRAEKGILFTTGYFTDGARDAARDIMSKQIELVDGDRLIELLEQHEFGLTKATTYVVDYAFVTNYSAEKKKGSKDNA